MLLKVGYQFLEKQPASSFTSTTIFQATKNSHASTRVQVDSVSSEAALNHRIAPSERLQLIQPFRLLFDNRLQT